MHCFLGLEPSECVGDVMCVVDRVFQNTHSRLHPSEIVFCGNSGMQNAQQPPPTPNKMQSFFCVH